MPTNTASVSTSIRASIRSWTATYPALKESDADEPECHHPGRSAQTGDTGSARMAAHPGLPRRDRGDRRSDHRAAPASLPVVDLWRHDRRYRRRGEPGEGTQVV